MNYSSKILSYLTGEERCSQVLLVAGAPPVEKIGAEFRIVINTVLSPDDIRDTLATLASHARRPGAAELGSHGVFSFGMPNLGRFRVHYLTQRGSDLVSIQRMPLDIPKLADLLADPGQLTLVEDMINQPDGGFVFVTGPSPVALSRFAYSVLSHINDTRNTIVCIYEQTLSYVLRHRNSVVIQVEAGTDTPTLEEGIKGGLFLAPDLIYVRDCRTRQELSALICAAEAGTLVLSSAVSFNEHYLLQDLRGRMDEDFEALYRHLKRIVKVAADRNGKVTLAAVAMPDMRTPAPNQDATP
jgi:twitching motility protein PilT